MELGQYLLILTIYMYLYGFLTIYISWMICFRSSHLKLFVEIGVAKSIKYSLVVPVRVHYLVKLKAGALQLH